MFSIIDSFKVFFTSLYNPFLHLALPLLFCYIDTILLQLLKHFVSSGFWVITDFHKILLPVTFVVRRSKTWDEGKRLGNYFLC